MDIIYVDPGYGKGMTTDGTLTTVESGEYNPVNGVAFTGNNCSAIFPIPSSGLSIPSETINNYKFNRRYLSLKLSVYCKDMTTDGEFHAGFATTSSTTAPDFASVTLTRGNCKSTGTYSKAETLINSFNGGFHNIVISVCKSYHKLNSYNDGRHISWIDIDGVNSFYYSDENHSMVMPDYVGIWFPADSAGNFYISNVMYVVATESTTTGPPVSSLEPLLSSETLLIKLPLNNTSGDFLSVGDGEYVGNTSGQKLLSTIDASSVIEKFGASSKVSHLVTYGAPGYRVGSNVTTAYGISESDSTITSHGSTELSTDTDATACVAWEADSGTTLPDIDGLKIGWQV